MSDFAQRVVNLSEPEKRLQAIIREIGKNEPTFAQENHFKRAWDNAVNHLMTENSALNLTQAGRILHQVCEQARAEL